MLGSSFQVRTSGVMEARFMRGEEREGRVQRRNMAQGKNKRERGRGNIRAAF
jgi:hypothetical protein